MGNLRLVLTFVDIALFPLVLVVLLLRISKRLGKIGNDLGESFATAWQVVVDVMQVPDALGQVNGTLETIAGAAPLLIGLAQELGDALEAQQAQRVPVGAGVAAAPARQVAHTRSASRTPRRVSYLGATAPAGSRVAAAPAGKTPRRVSYLGATAPASARVAAAPAGKTRRVSYLT